METVIIIAAVAAANIACFLIGVKTGVAVAKGEEIKLIEIPRTEDHTVKEARQEAEWEKQRMDTILRNIDNYDGTPYGQEDVPRG